MRRLIAHVLAAGALLALAFMARPAAAAEEILSYDVSVDVAKDGALDVTERIRVNAEGNRIRHGIYRDFPVAYRLPSGFVRGVGFTVTGVQRDGHDEPWHSSRIDRFERVYIGDKDTYVSPGEHDYVLRYRTTRQLRHFPDNDEIYWNATGNFWTFPILAATARIDLPPGARILRTAAYTGAYGASGKDWRITAESDTSITFQTTRPLARHEGLTVAVAFPKGIVPEPGAFDLWLASLWDNLGFAALIAAMVAVGAYFLLTWLRIGRDPDKGTVIPLFSPPDGMSPGLVSYISYQGFDTVRSGIPRAFVAALMDMAVKGNIKIVEDDGDIELRSLKISYPSLSRGESVIVDRLLSGRDRVPFDKAHGSMLADTISRFRTAILKENAGVYFRNNFAAFAVGIGLSVVSLIAFFILQRPPSDQLGLAVPTVIATLAATWLIAAGGRRLLDWVPGGSSKLFGIVLLLAGLAIAAGIAFVMLADVLVLNNTLPVVILVSLIALAAMNVSFFYLLRAPTPRGRKIMDGIEGFKLYLSVAEEGRLNVNDEPEMSEQLFERFLPYAVALAVEKPWTRAFQKWLAVAHPEAAQGAYMPFWYSGRGFTGSSLDRATAAMVTGLAAGMVAAMPSQSSSGSSGGGFSGGGGGGGGGGGW